LILGPDLARAAPAVLEGDLPSGALGSVVIVVPLVLAWLVLFAVATLRAKVYPRPMAALLLLSPVGAGALFFVGAGIGFLVGDVAFGAVVAWMGYFLWTERSKAGPVPLATAA